MHVFFPATPAMPAVCSFNIHFFSYLRTTPPDNLPSPETQVLMLHHKATGPEQVSPLQREPCRSSPPGKQKLSGSKQNFISLSAP